MTTSLPARQQRPSRPPGQFLSFWLAGETLAALPIAQVMEVLSIPASQVVALPDMAECVLGVHNWRGEMLWMVDLGQMLGLPPMSADPGPRPVRTAIAVQAAGLRLGWAIERVEDTCWFEAEQVLPPPPLAFSARLAPFVSGYCMGEAGTMTLILDGRAVLTAPAWQSAHR